MTDQKAKPRRKGSTSSNASGGKAKQSQTKKLPVRVVAIGASAGGLEPYEKFFDAMPANSGLAFVVIQHLSPDFRSMMDELLARHTSMAIHRVEDGMEIEPNAIYLNAPRSMMVFKDNKLALLEPAKMESLSLPVNMFFESMAKDRGANAIGVVFSGTGSDGTKGCEAIKKAGGAVFVQEPESAKFDGMPNSVIAAGFADIVAPPQDIPKFLFDQIEGIPLVQKNKLLNEYKTPLEAILALLRDRVGSDFSMYKMLTIERRIRRRSEMRGETDLVKYLDVLEDDSEEISALYNDLLIEVTSFFRDSEAFEIMENVVVPDIAAQMSAERQIRIWVPGCASGEEAYSIGILFADYAEKHKLPLNLKILATDIHSRSLNAASSGIYTEESLKSLSADRIARHFVKEGSYYQINQSLRKNVVFSPHSLLSDPPFTRMDLVSCRNVMIYFNDVAQHKALSLFHFSLSKDGYLFLGPSETVGQLSDEFKTVHQRWRIFQKTRDVKLLESTSLVNTKGQREHNQTPLAPVLSPTGASSFNPAARRAFNDALQNLLTRYAPAGFLINPAGDLVHVFGDAGEFIRVGAGGFSNRIVDLIHEQLKLTISAALERSKGVSKAGFRRRAQFVEQSGRVSDVIVTLDGLPDANGQVDYLLLTLEKATEDTVVEIAVPHAETLHATDAVEVLQGRISELERDLESTEESLQTTIEELETSNEELQATNEELMASNEELQSTNEELHSVNEELFTVSAEHQRKIEELTELTSDMDHLLKSTDIGTIFLDADLRIRRFTPAANKTFNLISQDVGRPIAHVTYRFLPIDLISTIEQALRTGAPSDREVDVDGHIYLLRILPFMPSTDDISGVVITIIDIQALKNAQKKTLELADFYAGVLTDLSEFIVRWNAEDGIVTYSNEAFALIEGMPSEMVVGKRIQDFVPDLQQEEFFKAISDLKVGGSTAMRLQHHHTDGRVSWREVTIRAIGDKDGKVEVFQKTGRDATQSIAYLEGLEALMEVPDGADSESDNWLRTYLEIGRDYFDVEHALLSRLEGKGAVIDQYLGPDKTGFPIGDRKKFKQNLCAKVASSGDIVAQADLAVGRLKGHASIKELGIRNYIGLPIRLGENMYATMSFFSTKTARPAPYSDTDIGFIKLMAQWMQYKLERENQLRALHRSEQELQHIFDHVPARIWYKDHENKVLRLNRTAANSMGLSVEEAEGANLTELFPNMDEAAYKDDKRALDTGVPEIGLIEPYEPANGQLGWSRTDKIPYIEATTKTRNLLVVSQDITEVKEQEIRLRALNEELDQQKQLYFNLYRNTPVMMQSITRDGTIVEVSNQWLDKLGYSREEVVDKKSTEFMTEASKKYARDVVLPEFWKKGYCDAVPHGFVSKDGRVIDIELSGVKDRAGDPSGHGLGVLIDVTERNAAFSEIERKNVELEQANDGLLKFAYVASHDLQEPLRKIRQFSEMLVSDHNDGLDDEGRYYLDVVASSAARMSRLIRDLLNYSKTSNRGLSKIDADWSEIAANVVDELQIALENAGATVKIGKLPTLSCDPTMVGQLFSNLFGNSLKYRKPDVPPKISVSARKKSGATIVTFADNGIGFDQEHAKKIFDPFARLHGAKDFDGSGIGLAVCRAVCDRHGWTISAQGTKGEGAIFTIIVPTE